MKFAPTKINGCFEIELNFFEDDRGEFFRQYCSKEMADEQIIFHVAQSNYSKTRVRGTIRGLHYQMPPMAEAKLLRVTRGRIYDVCVDLRFGSETFGRWHAVELDAESHAMFLLPKGCAHGFQTLTDNVEMMYFHDEFYASDLDRTVHYADKSLGIVWPLPVTAISEKDNNAASLPEDFGGLKL